MRVRRVLNDIAPRGWGRWLLLGGVLLLIPSWVIPFALLQHVVPAGELLPLHYNIHLGADFAARWYVSLFFPAFATFVLVLNTVLAARLRRTEKLLAMILTVSGTFVALFTLVALFFVLVLNA